MSLSGAQDAAFDRPFPGDAEAHARQQTLPWLREDTWEMKTPRLKSVASWLLHLPLAVKHGAWVGSVQDWGRGEGGSYCHCPRAREEGVNRDGGSADRELGGGHRVHLELWGATPTLPPSFLSLHQPAALRATQLGPQPPASGRCLATSEGWPVYTRLQLSGHTEVGPGLAKKLAPTTQGAEGWSLFQFIPFVQLMFLLLLLLMLFLGPHQWHVEVPRLGVKSVLQLPATATAMRDQSHICSLYQRWISH